MKLQLRNLKHLTHESSLCLSHSLLHPPYFSCLFKELIKCLPYAVWMFLCGCNGQLLTVITVKHIQTTGMQYCSLELLECWHHLLNVAIKYGCMSHFIYLKWELVQRQLLQRKPIGLGKCLCLCNENKSKLFEVSGHYEFKTQGYHSFMFKLLQILQDFRWFVGGQSPGYLNAKDLRQNNQQIHYYGYLL
ncbi:PREDICTED: uncharacterized protein LOC109178019 isoform X2 [Ipomoea nil]|uniref:uncharacterized protein LOC109178019 isoform X2 n=1 Tax=Ipomoea nil TaxID=35883 RepID=UPI000900BBE7|nr:PREDICTED: uncharacterized protein LOC109178019 isoform X2 [Ipomoea nil]